ncbi:MAG: hypothetical protein ACRCZU_03880, partial [Selenomonadaceae bacterium]
MSNHFVHSLFFYTHLGSKQAITEKRAYDPFPHKTAFLQFMRLSSNVVFYCGIYKDCARWKPGKSLNVPVPSLFERFFC